MGDIATQKKAQAYTYGHAIQEALSIRVAPEGLRNYDDATEEEKLEELAYNKDEWIIAPDPVQIFPDGTCGHVPKDQNFRLVLLAPRFPKFCLLPVELRQLIWKEALPKPQIVRLYHAFENYDDPYAGPGDVYWTKFKIYRSGISHWLMAAEGLYFACHESRGVFLETYNKSVLHTQSSFASTFSFRDLPSYLMTTLGKSRDSLLLDYLTPQGDSRVDFSSITNLALSVREELDSTSKFFWESIPVNFPHLLYLTYSFDYYGSDGSNFDVLRESRYIDVEELLGGLDVTQYQGDDASNRQAWSETIQKELQTSIISAAAKTRKSFLAAKANTASAYWNQINFRTAITGYILPPSSKEYKFQGKEDLLCLVPMVPKYYNVCFLAFKPSKPCTRPHRMIIPALDGQVDCLEDGTLLKP